MKSEPHTLMDCHVEPVQLLLLEVVASFAASLRNDRLVPSCGRSPYCYFIILRVWMCPPVHMWNKIDPVALLNSL